MGTITYMYTDTGLPTKNESLKAHSTKLLLRSALICSSSSPTEDKVGFSVE